MNPQLLRRPLLSILSALIFAPATASANAMPLHSSPLVCNAAPAVPPLGKLHSFHQSMGDGPEHGQPQLHDAAITVATAESSWSLPTRHHDSNDICTA